jgi:hypothetical protein
VGTMDHRTTERGAGREPGTKRVELASMDYRTTENVES